MRFWRACCPLHPRLIDLSLDRMWRLLAALDHPQDKCPPIIHIAGTNGKGSTAAMLRAMLEADGKRCMPIIRPIWCAFMNASYWPAKRFPRAALAPILARVEAANQGRPITFFEVTTAAAFLAFAEMPADYLILEVGLGGRLDATNVITPFYRPSHRSVSTIRIFWAIRCYPLPRKKRAL